MFSGLCACSPPKQLNRNLNPRNRRGGAYLIVLWEFKYFVCTLVHNFLHVCYMACSTHPPWFDHWILAKIVKGERGFTPQIKAVIRRRPVFDPSSDHVGFMVDKVTLWQLLSEYLGFPCQLPFYQPILSRVWATIDGIWIGYWIYWPLIHVSTSNYSATANLHNSQSPYYPLSLFSLLCLHQLFPGNGF
jgi:hypothetical protein